MLAQSEKGVCRCATCKLICAKVYVERSLVNKQKVCTPLSAVSVVTVGVGVDSEREVSRESNNYSLKSESAPLCHF